MPNIRWPAAHRFHGSLVRSGPGLFQGLQGSIACQQGRLAGHDRMAQMKELINPDLHFLFTSDFFTPEGNPKINKLEQTLSLHSLLGDGIQKHVFTWDMQG